MLEPDLVHKIVDLILQKVVKELLRAAAAIK